MVYIYMGIGRWEITRMLGIINLTVSGGWGYGNNNPRNTLITVVPIVCSLGKEFIEKNVK